MAKFEWKPEGLYSVYLTNKKATHDLKEPDNSSCRPHQSISVPCFKLGFKSELPYEREKEKGYQYDNEGLVLTAERWSHYSLKVAQLKKEKTFEEFSWEEIDTTSNRISNGDFMRVNTFRFTQDHPYEGPIDSVMVYRTTSQEGDCGPRSAFEAFFHHGKLVAGWDNNNRERSYKDVPLTNCRELADLLNNAGKMPHPSAEQVREYLRESNLPATLLTRFEEFLIR